MKVFHGSDHIIKRPVYGKGRSHTDFGLGFYLTPDYDMARLWACRDKKTKTPIITEYELDEKNLNIYTFSLDNIWLDFVITNRYGISPNLPQIDAFVGATADDRMFSTIELYQNGLLNPEMTIQILNCMQVGIQICLKSPKAFSALQFVQPHYISKSDQQVLFTKNQSNREKAKQSTQKMLNNHRQSKPLTNLQLEGIIQPNSYNDNEPEL